MKTPDILREKCKQLALRSLTGLTPSFIAEVGLKYRKDKVWVDVAEAIRKGLQAGNGRTECELDMIACYLEGVLKVDRKFSIKSLMESMKKL